MEACFILFLMWSQYEIEMQKQMVKCLRKSMNSYMYIILELKETKQLASKQFLVLQVKRLRSIKIFGSLSQIPLLVNKRFGAEIMYTKNTDALLIGTILIAQNNIEDRTQSHSYKSSFTYHIYKTFLSLKFPHLYV